MNNVHYSARPFYLVSRALGTFSYSYDGSFQCSAMKQTFSGILSTYMSTAAVAVIFAINIFAGDSIISTSKVLSFAWDSSLILSFAMLLSLKVYQIFKQKSIWRFLQLIEQFDKKVIAEVRNNQKFKFRLQAVLMQLVTNYSRHRKISIGLLLASFSVFCFHSFFLQPLYIAMSFTDTIKPVFTTSFAFELFCMFFYVQQFVHASLSLTSRFNLLNSYLRWVVKSNWGVFK